MAELRLIYNPESRELQGMNNVNNPGIVSIATTAMIQNNTD